MISRLGLIIANVAYCVKQKVKKQVKGKKVDGEYIRRSIEENYADNQTQKERNNDNKVIEDIESGMNSSFNSKWERIIDPLEQH